MLRRLKEVAKRSGMDPDSCWLHKFRAGFATHALQGGVDLRTVQAWMGHTDLRVNYPLPTGRPAAKRFKQSRHCGLNRSFA